jgi:hypothetical protein
MAIIWGKKENQESMGYENGIATTSFSRDVQNLKFHGEAL